MDINASPAPTMIPVGDFFAERKALFPSPHSGTWYVRKHRPDLVRAGALVLHGGRWHANAVKFDEFVADEAKRAAERAIA